MVSTRSSLLPSSHVGGYGLISISCPQSRSCVIGGTRLFLVVWKKQNYSTDYMLFDGYRCHWQSVKYLSLIVPQKHHHICRSSAMGNIVYTCTHLNE